MTVSSHYIAYGLPLLWHLIGVIYLLYLAYKDDGYIRIVDVLLASILGFLGTFILASYTVGKIIDIIIHLTEKPLVASILQKQIIRKEKS